MTSNIPSPYKGKTVKKTVIKDVEDDIDELPDSYFSKSAERLFNKINDVKYGVLPSSKFVDLVETLGGGVHSEDMVSHMWKVDPN